MGLIRLCQVASFLLLAAGAAAVAADDRKAYNLRASTEDVRLFLSLDRNADGLLTKEESKGDLNLGPRFDDMDTDRDGIVTRQELERYVEARYGVRTSLVASR